ncbi:hypothetical protein [Spirochaeta dissipatitropha]
MKKLTACIIIGLCIPAFTFGLGGGGIFWGESHVIPNYLFDGELQNTSAEFTYRGGYGYGVNRYGQRNGGFGMIISSVDTSAASIHGVFGGGMTGGQLRLGLLTLSANMYAGIGHLGGPLLGNRSGFAVLGEVNAEAGVRITSWMQVSVYGGMQGMSRFGAPSRVANTAVYSPVIGTRLTWGSF